MSEVTADHADECLKRMVERGAAENARKTMLLIKQMFSDSEISKTLGTDDTMRRIGANVPPKKRRPKNHAAVTDPGELAGILKLMDGHAGSLVVRTALKLTPLLFLRAGELRHLRWADVRLDERALLIPAERIGFDKDAPEDDRTPQRGLKGDVDLIVPLSNQAIQLFNQIKPYTGLGGFVFPSARSKPDAPIQQQRPMSENTINTALRAVGIDRSKQSTHGFRATARTILAERLGYSPSVIEAQLAHNRIDQWGNAYDRTQYMDDRIRMMQDWSDLVDRLKGSKEAVVLPFRGVNSK